MNSVLTQSACTRKFRRFNRSQRVQHAIQILTFTTLCFTGLIQKFSTSDTLETLIILLGGVERIRFVHRIAAGVFVVEALYHALELGWLILVKRARLSMLLNIKDGRDAVQMFKYFLGVTSEQPRYDRFDFKQKVEYLSLIWGSIVMISTGLIMWFPVVVTTIIPGELVPAARVAHGGEGLLACLVIFTWHMYSAHFAPGIFPADTTIFTGLISEARMVHEHPLEYARIMAAEVEIAVGDDTEPLTSPAERQVLSASQVTAAASSGAILTLRAAIRAVPIRDDECASLVARSAADAIDDMEIMDVNVEYLD